MDITTTLPQVVLIHFPSKKQKQTWKPILLILYLQKTERTITVMNYTPLSPIYDYLDRLN